MSERIYCSQQNPNEPMIGTADQVDVWVLLEYKPAWQARAVEQGSFGEATRRWLDDGLAALADAGLKARPQLIRRPELDSDDTHLLVGVGDSLIEFAGAGYDFLDAVPLADVAARPEAFPALAEPHYFVCTNGQRDLCCARFGLPVYAGLRERVGQRVWQVTHLGGHRFAPNVLTLPQGALYGRLDEANLDAFVAQVESGALAFEWLRGRSRLAPAAQAAEALSGRSDLTFLGMEHHDGVTTVRFQGADGARALQVRQTEAQVLKSCADAAASPVTPFVPA